MPNIFQPQPLSAADLAPLTRTPPEINYDPRQTDQAFASAKAIGDSMGQAFTPLLPQNRLAEELKNQTNILQQNSLKKLPAGADRMDLDVIENYAKLYGAPRYTPEGMYDVGGMRDVMVKRATEFNAAQLNLLRAKSRPAGMSVSQGVSATLQQAWGQSTGGWPTVQDEYTGQDRDATPAEAGFMLWQPEHQETRAVFENLQRQATKTTVGNKTASTGAAVEGGDGQASLAGMSQSLKAQILTSEAGSQASVRMIEDAKKTLTKYGRAELGIGSVKDQAVLLASDWFPDLAKAIGWDATDVEQAQANYAGSANAAAVLGNLNVQLGFNIPKILDPGSVAREGEQRTIQKLTGLQDWFSVGTWTSDQGATVALANLNKIQQDIISRRDFYKAALAVGGPQYQLGVYYQDGKGGQKYLSELVDKRDPSKGVQLVPLGKLATESFNEQAAKGMVQAFNLSDVTVLPGGTFGPMRTTPNSPGPASVPVAPEIPLPPAVPVSTGAAKVGDVHVFTDGSTREFTPSGTWEKVDNQGATVNKASTLLGKTPPLTLPTTKPLTDVGMTPARKLSDTLLNSEGPFPALRPGDTH